MIAIKLASEVQFGVTSSKTFFLIPFRYFGNLIADMLSRPISLSSSLVMEQTKRFKISSQSQSTGLADVFTFNQRLLQSRTNNRCLIILISLLMPKASKLSLFLSNHPIDMRTLLSPRMFFCPSTSPDFYCHRFLAPSFLLPWFVPGLSSPSVATYLSHHLSHRAPKKANSDI